MTVTIITESVMAHRRAGEIGHVLYPEGPHPDSLIRRIV